MVGVAMTAPIAKALGKKTTYMLSFAALIVLSILFFYIPVTQSGYWWMLILQIVISVFTGIISPLVWSMYADVSDYAENRDGTASTALIFSSASMAQKFGGAFGGAAVMWILAAFGYNTEAGAVQTPEAILGLKLLMSWIPAAVSVIAIVTVFFYPLTKKRMESIQEELAVKRGPIIENASVSEEQGIGQERGGLWKGLPKVMRWAICVLAGIMAVEAVSALSAGVQKDATVAQADVECVVDFVKNA